MAFVSAFPSTAAVLSNTVATFKSTSCNSTKGSAVVHSDGDLSRTVCSFNFDGFGSFKFDVPAPFSSIGTPGFPGFPNVTKFFAAEVGSGSGGDGGDAGNSGGGGRGDGEGESGEGGNPLFKIWNFYLTSLESKPVLTKCMTSATGFALGDILAQNFLREDENTPFDFGRFLRLVSFGFLVHATTGHVFYGQLDKLIPGNGPVQVASKVFTDQILWAPIFSFMFFTYIGALEGKSVGEIVDKIKNDTWASVSGSWKVWPIAHAINFRFVPTELRILYINGIQVFYNVFLSWLANKKADAPAPAVAEGEAKK